MRVGGVGGKSSRVELRGAWRIESKNWYITGNQITRCGEM